MELKEFIKAGIEKAGSVKELALVVGIHPNSITDAKNGRRGLPAVQCVKLAELIEADAGQVRLASDLASEKDEGAKAILRPFVIRARIAGIAAAMIATFGTVNPYPAYADGLTSPPNVYYVKSKACQKTQTNKRYFIYFSAVRSFRLISPAFSNYANRA